MYLYLNVEKILNLNIILYITLLQFNRVEVL